MLDILDSYRKSYQYEPRRSDYIDHKSIAVYKRISGDVDHIEQSFLDSDYINKVPAVSNIDSVSVTRIGLNINLYV